MAPSSNSHLELNVLMAPSESPLIALMVLPPSTSKVAINLRLNPDGFSAGASTTGTLTEAVSSPDGPREPKDGTVIPAAPKPDRVLKRSPGTAWAQPPAKFPKKDSIHVQEGPSNPSTAPKAGPSTVKITGVPQYVPDSQEELLVLPPMPRSLFEELTMFSDNSDSSVTEPETSEDEACARRGVAGK